MDGVLVLPQRLDALAAQRLAAELLGLRGKPLTIHAESVETISALALEVIVAAGLQWEQDGAILKLNSASVNFRSACQTLGLNTDQPWISTPEQPEGE
jgi:anti-anti-sigma regulatory factor